MEKYHLGLDIGGNLLRIARVNPETGKFIGRLESLSLEDATTNSELSAKIIEAVKSFCPPEQTIGLGICGAGDIDEKKLIVKKSPNSRVNEKLTYPRDLKKAGYNVTITNDMKAAVQDSARFGEGKNHNDVCTATYSEGHNAAVARQRKNVSQAEFGHHQYNPHGELFDGDGGLGHLEIYVSAKGAETRAKQFFDVTNQRNHLILHLVAEKHKFTLRGNEETAKNKITAREVYEAYRQQPEQNPQRAIREAQVEAIAYSFGLMNSVWAPLDIIVYMGGLTGSSDVIFDGTDGAISRYSSSDEKFQLAGFKKPKIVVTNRKEIGVRGAVAYYLSEKERA